MSGSHVFTCAGCGVQSPAHVSSGNMTNLARAHVCAETCPACGYRRGRRHLRGLCESCHLNPDVRIDYSTQRWRADDMLDTWDELRREGYTVRQAAERMGVTFAALDKALCRGKRRGDPRARRPGERAGAA